MKRNFKALLISLVFMFFVSGASALVLIVDNATDFVYSVAEKDNTIVPENHTKHILPGGFDNYQFQSHPTHYKYIDGKFILNVQKVSDEAIAATEREEKAAEEILVREKLQDMAIDALRAEGKVFKHLKKKGE